MTAARCPTWFAAGTDDARVDPNLAALRRGEVVPDRRHNLFIWSWRGALSYDEAERLLPDEELDALCDVLNHLQEDAVLARSYAVEEAMTDGWILTSSQRAWLRAECGLPPTLEQTADDARRMEAWIGGRRIQKQIEHLARWTLDARVDWDLVDERLTEQEYRHLLELVDPDELRRIDGRVFELDEVERM